MFVNALMGRAALKRSRRFLSIATSKTGEAEIAGLLMGANNTHFSRNLNLVSAANLIQNSDAVFQKAISKDVETSGKDAQQYLSEVMKKASQYLEEDDICGRSRICAKIKNAMLQKGSFTFITGGNSVGKSKILANVVGSIGKDQVPGDKKNPPTVPVSVVMVDGRQQKDLVQALDSVARGQAAAVREVMSSLTFSTSAGVVVDFDFKGITFSLGDVADAVYTLAHNHSRNTNHIVLILDEANLFLDSSGNEAVAQRARGLFNAVVRHTKQLMRMSVVLVSSDDRLPCHLFDDLGLDPNHITRTLVIGEPTPGESLDLLRNRFGVGENLNAALVDCYGGNVYQMCKLLQRLPSEYDVPKSRIKVFMGPATDISNAVGAWVADNGSEGEILQVLEELARTGFVPMSSDNKLARLLAKFNVCAFLTEDAVQYQVPDELRAMDAGLVPASQLLRVLIAWKLVCIKNRKSKIGK